ncbi:MAG: DUF2256 and DUF3253 domain-containing protein [Verrucomicrobiota bacterium]
MNQDQKEKRICQHCGRPFSWRKKWEKVWDEIKYCSQKCRSESKRSVHRRYEEGIIELLRQRNPHQSICPSEVARAIHTDESEWRLAMEPVRQAARRLAHRGEVRILQKGNEVSPSCFKGPIRLQKR